MDTNRTLVWYSLQREKPGFEKLVENRMGSFTNRTAGCHLARIGFGQRCSSIIYICHDFYQFAWFVNMAINLEYVDQKKVKNLTYLFIHFFSRKNARKPSRLIPPAIINATLIPSLFEIQGANNGAAINDKYWVN